MTAAWESVVRSRTDLTPQARSRLAHLIQDWALLADLGFSDLVLFVRTWDAAGWIAAAHVRPSTAPTLLVDDPVGSFLPRSRATPLERAYHSREISRAHRQIDRDARLRGAEPLEAIPVLHGNEVIAAIARYSAIDRRRLGDLESQYLAAFEVLLGMVARGEFPQPAGERVGAAGPRVGDGMIRLDESGRVVFASPNARTCLRHLGVPEPVVGADLAEELSRAGRRGVPLDGGAARVARAATAGESEFESPTATMTMSSIPLVGAAGPAGGVVLVRDVTDLRRQEQALLSKDATIREIHHRVKNNLQTVGSLLRLQARRLPEGDSRAALLDAVARVSTIALVHDSLSRSPGETVDFDEVCRRVLAMARDVDTAQGRPHRTTVTVEGTFGVLPSDPATPLAMVLSEVLLNAVEHGDADHVRVVADRSVDRLTLVVADDGIGFDPRAVEGLGLQIVATLVTGQLRGGLQIVSGGRAPWPDDDTGAENWTPPAGSVTAVRVTCPL